MRRKLIKLLPQTVGDVGVSNKDFIFMHFPKDVFETDCVWLLGNYMELVETVVVGTGKDLGKEHLKGVLSDRLVAMKKRSVLRPDLVL